MQKQPNSCRRPQVKHHCNSMTASTYRTINLVNLNGFGETGDGEVAAKELVQQELKCSGAEPEREGWCQQDLGH